MKRLISVFSKIGFMLASINTFAQFPMASSNAVLDNTTANSKSRVQCKLYQKASNDVFIPTICTSAGLGQNRLTVYWSTNPSDFNDITSASWGYGGNSFLFNQGASPNRRTPYKTLYICNSSGSFDFTLGDGEELTTYLLPNMTYYYKFYYYEWSNGSLITLNASPIYTFKSGNPNNLSVITPAVQNLLTRENPKTLTVTGMSSGNWQSSTDNSSWSNVNPQNTNSSFTPPSAPSVSNIVYYRYLNNNNMASQTAIVSYSNNIPSVTVDGQTWMTFDLKTDHFDDGTAINQEKTLSNWPNVLSTSTYYTADLIYYYYNYQVISTSKNVCPTGWAVPSTRDFETLKKNENYIPVFGNDYNGAIINNSTISGLNEYGNWWDSSYFNWYNQKSNNSTFSKNSVAMAATSVGAFAVRCIKR